eukprot:CAMPEP_0173192758 /NCGR_PEP_ID=MMETSP1141-20130122/13589_1 /TAXON_ID=483371 /ORGANISM="non described non described, Strain CCMP2298" /LENGTH=79 /DNA_ID=CAMNT_0014117035 /DNA_START=761 /DNA_END=1000 /DNA_ORIENTATION=+
MACAVFWNTKKLVNKRHQSPCMILYMSNATLEDRSAVLMMKTVTETILTMGAFSNPDAIFELKIVVREEGRQALNGSEF